MPVVFISLAALIMSVARVAVSINGSDREGDGSLPHIGGDKRLVNDLIFIWAMALVAGVVSAL